MEIGEVLLLDSILKNRDTWDPHPILIVKRIVFISWKPLSLTFLKINFDSNVTGMTVGARFIIWGLDSKLIAAGDVHLLDPSMPDAKLRAAWKSITYADLFSRQTIRLLRGTRHWLWASCKNTLTVVLLLTLLFRYLRSFIGMCLP